MFFRRYGREGEFGEGFRDADDGFELADCDRDAGADVSLGFGGRDAAADGDEVAGELLGGGGGEARGAAAVVSLLATVRTWEGGKEGNSRLAEAYISLHLLDGDLNIDLLLEPLTPLVDIHDVLRDLLIAVAVVVIPHNKDHIEPRQDCRLEVDVLAGALQVVVAAEDWVRCREDARARIQDRRDARLRDRDRLLFHRFVDRDAVFVAHLVEFVDADDAAVSEDHRATFEVEFSALRVALDGGGQACGRGALAAGVDGDRGDFFDEFEELRFCCAGVAEEEDVDVAAELHAVREDLLGTAHEEAGDCFFDVGVAVDGGCDAAGEFGVEVWVFGEGFEFLLLFFGEVAAAFCCLVDVCGDANGAEVRISDGDGRVLLAAFRLVDREDAHYCASRPRHDSICEVAVG